jgi:Cu+-exporting ATPase
MNVAFNVQSVDMAVGGMTCSMCSNAVLAALRTVPGVLNVDVSLATNLAHVEYRESPGCNVNIIRETIEDIGYDVNDIIIPKQKTELPKIIELAVSGMTCSMCSNAVHAALIDIAGVLGVEVSLATNIARIEFQESRDCNAERLKDTVECIGYDVDDVIVIQREKGKTPNITELAVGGMTCSMCSNAVHAALIDLPGVISVDVSLATNVARIEFQESSNCNTESLKDTVECIGYDVNDVMEVNNESDDFNDEELQGPQPNDSDDRLQRILRQQDGQLQARKSAFIWSFVGALPILCITMVIPKLWASDCALIQFLHKDVVIFKHSFVMESVLLWLLTTPVQFICGFSFYKTSFHGIRRGILGMDVLVSLGTTASYIYAVMATFSGDPSYRFFETSAVLICFVLLGKWIQAMAVCRTSEALTHLMKLQAKTALLVLPDKKNTEKWDPLVDSYKEKVVSINDIHPGDIVKVLKGASIPADGILIHGECCVDESMITGESIPVLKTSRSQVLGGTICTETGTGNLKFNDTTAGAFIRVTGVGSSTALAQIVQLVQSAQSRQVPIQNLADRIASVFVPSVVAISFITTLIWYSCCKNGVVPDSWYQGESPETFSLLFGIACLVISCPCALGLATPTAVMVSRR